MLWLVSSHCTKIERTEMGGDLIPPVDNVFTFDTLLTVIANNYLPEDSTRLSQNAIHVAGGINNDPLFGASKATTFFQFRPFSFPFKFTDSVATFDSAVVILRFNGQFGDSSYPVQFNLYEVFGPLLPDTTILPTYTLQPNIGINRAKFWGTKTMQANRYRDTINIKRGDSIYSRVNNQLRIPLNQSLASALFFGDSLNVFGSDSIFNKFLPGWALEPLGSPNSLHYFNLVGGSEIKFYYRTKNGSREDTVERSFGMTSRSGHAVHFERNRSGAEIENFQIQNPTAGVEQIYVDGTPGAMASLFVPGINVMSNRVLHRVELRVTELTPNTSGAQSQLTPPRALYLDAEQEREPGNFRGLPFDLNPFTNYFCFPASGIDFNYFGGIPKRRTIDGQTHTEYIFNITRYVQSVITRSEPSFYFRLSIPYNLYYKDCVNPSPLFPPQIFPFVSGNTYINEIGEGRIRVAGGNHPDPRLRMQVRVIYSTL
jgi:hypothetical protein